MEEKGIMTVDFILATIIALIIISGVLSYTNLAIGTAQSAEQAKAKTMADELARAINKVYNSGDGHYLKFELPDNYTASISGNKVTVTYITSNGRYSVSTFIIPSLNKDLVTNNYTISNSNGAIQISP